jgi:hypothetical protein
VKLTDSARQELEWWSTSLQEWNGQCFLPQATEVDAYTDSSDDHWGLVIDKEIISRSWSDEEMDQHINWKELKVVWHLIQHPLTKGKLVNVISDNTTTIAYINKFGGTRSPQLMDLAEEIWSYCLETGTRLRTTYVPSQFNPADAPSRRMNTQLEWSISQEFFQELDSQWGPHTVDLFATKANAKLKQYVSWRPDPQAIAHNALNISWKNKGKLYICPPWNLIPSILQKMQEEQTVATVVTPYWPSAIWFPKISRWAVDPPTLIPRAQVLPAPGNDASVLAKNPMWSLCAWNVDSRH